MLDQEQGEPNANNEMISGNSAHGQAWTRFTQRLDSFLDSLYRNRLPSDPPKSIDGQVWGMPVTTVRFPWESDSSAENTLHKSSYFLHYFQSQGYGPTTNECVTTSASMG